MNLIYPYLVYILINIIKKNINKNEFRKFIYFTSQGFNS